MGSNKDLDLCKEDDKVEEKLVDSPSPHSQKTCHEKVWISVTRARQLTCATHFPPTQRPSFL